MWVKNRSLFFTFVTICSMVAFVHKSFGPQDLTLSGGAVSINVTTVDVLILLLYGIWISEGTFVADVRAAARRRILWLPLVGVLFLLPSLVKAVDPYHSFSELFRMGVHVPAVLLRGRAGADPGHGVGGARRAGRVRRRSSSWSSCCSGRPAACSACRSSGCRPSSRPAPPTPSELGRPFGTIIHPVFMGAVMGSLGLMAVALGLTLKRSLLKVAALGMALVCTLPLYLAHTRAALVAFVLVVLVMVAVAIAHRQLQWRSVGRICVVLLIAAAVFWPQLTKVWSENFNTGHFSEEVESRKELNDLAGRMIDDHPVLGVGLNNFELVMGPYEKYGIIFFDNPVHNVYLLYLSETGIVGLAGVILVGVGMYNVALRLSRSRDRLLGGIGLGVSGGDGLPHGRGAARLLAAPGHPADRLLAARRPGRGLLPHGRLRRLARPVVATPARPTRTAPARTATARTARTARTGPAGRWSPTPASRTATATGTRATAHGNGHHGNGHDGNGHGSLARARSERRREQRARRPHERGGLEPGRGAPPRAPPPETHAPTASTASTRSICTTSTSWPGWPTSSTWPTSSHSCTRPTCDAAALRDAVPRRPQAGRPRGGRPGRPPPAIARRPHPSSGSAP